MKKVLALIILLCPALAQAQQLTKDYPIQPVDFTRVRVTGGFWKSRLDTVTRRTIPYAFHKCEETGRINNFIYAGKLKEGKFVGKFGFDDSDLYKVMEGASYALMTQPNPSMEAYLDQLISYLSAAQEQDGYLYTPWTLKANDYNVFTCCSYNAKGKFEGTKWSHELYNAGHMYEAAVAHYQATKKDNFLKIAIKNADLIYKLCVTEGMGVYPGHQEIELGLVKLYRVTQNKKYLALAKLFLDRRGQNIVTDEKAIHDASYAQDHLKVIEQTEAVGHSVRAVYMYAAMADIAAITGDKAYLNAIDAIWNDVVSKKMYITGGLGAAPHIEGFDAAYELPNSAYAETCAAIGNVYWNHRMFLLHGESKFIDVLERTLYNGLMAALSLDGENFLYPNPLSFDGSEKFNQGAICRSPWFDCSCCPSNLSRFVPSVSGYTYAVRNNEVFVNLFMNSDAHLTVKNHAFKISQKTNYPWSGEVEVNINDNTNLPIALKIRIPGWSQNEVVPSDLYFYNHKYEAKAIISLNGKTLNYEMENGYAVVTKLWKKGDRIVIHFPMESKTISSHSKIKANVNALAVQRGPLLYCAEGVDNPDMDMTISEKSNWKPDYNPTLLNGVSTLSGKGFSIKSQKEVAVKLLPYMVWGHRKTSPMAVWMQKR